MQPPSDWIAYILDDLRKETDIAVVGMSGGADSSLVTCLCTLALGSDRVYGVHMPYNAVDRQTFNDRSTRLATHLGIHSLTAPITGIADAIQTCVTDATQTLLPSCELTRLNKGNARSRARMCILYGIAHHLTSLHPTQRVRVMGTGNLSEDAIGYDTKGGDALADMFPIGHLFKTDVYRMLETLRDQGILLEEHIDRVPSAGLWEGQTDEQELGYSYAAMEPYVGALLDPANYGSIEHAYEQRGAGAATELLHVAHELLQAQGMTSLWDPELALFVLRRHFQNRHKHMAPKVTPLRWK